MITTTWKKMKLLMKIIPFATNIFFFSCMMLLDIAKFYGIIGRKKMKSIWEPLARHCSFIPSFFFSANTEHCSGYSSEQ